MFWLACTIDWTRLHSNWDTGAKLATLNSNRSYDFSLFAYIARNHSQLTLLAPWKLCLNRNRLEANVTGSWDVLKPSRMRKGRPRCLIMRVTIFRSCVTAGSIGKPWWRTLTKPTRISNATTSRSESRIWTSWWNRCSSSRAVEKTKKANDSVTDLPTTTARFCIHKILSDSLKIYEICAIARTFFPMPAPKLIHFGYEFIQVVFVSMNKSSECMQRAESFCGECRILFLQRVKIQVSLLLQWPRFATRALCIIFVKHDSLETNYLFVDTAHCPTASCPSIALFLLNLLNMKF